MKRGDLLRLQIQLLARLRVQIALGFFFRVGLQRQPGEVGQGACPRNAAMRFDLLDHLEHGGLSIALGELLRLGLHQQGHAECQFPLRPFTDRSLDDLAFPDELLLFVREPDVQEDLSDGGRLELSLDRYADQQAGPEAHDGPDEPDTCVEPRSLLFPECLSLSHDRPRARASDGSRSRTAPQWLL